MSEPTSYPPHSPDDPLEAITTVCNYCIVGCGYKAYLWQPGAGSSIPSEEVPHMSPSWIARVQHDAKEYVAAVVPDPRCPVNRGNHSIRGGTMGRTLTLQHNNPAKDEPATRERLTTPMIRLSNDQWVAMDWDETLELLANLIHKATNGFEQSRRVGAKLYGYHSLENTFAAATLFNRVIGTPNVAEHDRPSVAGSSPGLTDACIHHHAFSYDDLLDCDVVFLLGSNAYECQSVLFQQSIAGRRIVVLDPRRTITADYADRTGGMHLQPKVLGADCLIIHAIARLILEEYYSDPELHALSHLVSTNRVETGRNELRKDSKLRAAHRICSFEAWRKELLGNPEFEPHAVAKLTGIPLDQLREAAGLLADANLRSAILYEKGLIWGYTYANTAAVANLAILTFNFNAPNRPGHDPRSHIDELVGDLSRKRGFCGRLGGHQKGSATPKTKHPDAESTDLFVSIDEGLSFRIPNYQDYHLAGPVAYQANYGSPTAPRIEFAHKEDECKAHPEDISLFWVIGCNPAGDMSDAQRKWRRIRQRCAVGRNVSLATKEQAVDNLLERVQARSKAGMLGLVIVQQDIYANYTTEFADILLPASGFGEDPYTRYNGERRLRLYDRFQDSPKYRNETGEPEQRCCPDWKIFTAVAQQLKKRFADQLDNARKNAVPEWTDAEDVFTSLAEEDASDQSEILTGLRNKSRTEENDYYNILRKRGTTGVQLPAKKFELGPFFVDCRWQDVKDHFESMRPRDDEVWLTNGRVNEAWNSMYSNIRNEYLTQRYPDNLPGTVLEVNPEWARARRLEDGDVVHVLGTNGMFVGVIACQESVPNGGAFAMFSYPCNKPRASTIAREFFRHGYVNNITDGFVDPNGPISAFKYARAKIGRPLLSRVTLPTKAQRNRAFQDDPHRGDHDRWMAREILVSRGLPRIHIFPRDKAGAVVIPGTTHGVFWRTTHDSRDKFVQVPLMGQFPLVDSNTFDASKSMLIQMLEGNGPLPQMPMRAAPLPGRFIACIRDWIANKCPEHQFGDIQAILDYAIRIHARWFGPTSEPVEVLMLDPDRGIDMLNHRATLFLELIQPRDGGSRMCWRDEKGKVLSDWTKREFEILERFLIRGGRPSPQSFGFGDVRRILTTAVVGSSVMALHGEFWKRLEPEEFVTHKVMFAGGEIPLIRPFDGANSALIQALRGTGPFERFRMPWMHKPVHEYEIVQIERWIDNGCP